MARTGYYLLPNRCHWTAVLPARSWGASHGPRLWPTGVLPTVQPPRTLPLPPADMPLLSTRPRAGRGDLPRAALQDASGQANPVSANQMAHSLPHWHMLGEGNHTLDAPTMHRKSPVWREPATKPQLPPSTALVLLAMGLIRVGVTLNWAGARAVSPLPRPSSATATAGSPFPCWAMVLQGPLACSAHLAGAAQPRTAAHTGGSSSGATPAYTRVVRAGPQPGAWIHHGHGRGSRLGDSRQQSQGTSTPCTREDQCIRAKGQPGLEHSRGGR